LPACYIIKIRRPLRIRRLPYFLAYKESQISQKPSVQALYFLYPPAFYNRPWPYRREVSDSPRKNKAVEVFLLINVPARFLKTRGAAGSGKRRKQEENKADDAPAPRFKPCFIHISKGGFLHCAKDLYAVCR